MTLAEFHPLTVHFPIALLIVALAFDAAGLVWKRDRFFEAALYTQVLGALGAIAAVLSGNQAEDIAERVPGVEATLEAHEALGQWVMWISLAVVLVRGALIFKGLLAPRFRVGVGILSLGLAILVGVAGYYGGRAVYDFGAGVAPIMRALPAQQEGGPPARTP